MKAASGMAETNAHSPPWSIFEALTRQPPPFLKRTSVVGIRAASWRVYLPFIRSLPRLSIGNTVREFNLLHRRLRAEAPCYAGTRLPEGRGSHALDMVEPGNRSKTVIIFEKPLWKKRQLGGPGVEQFPDLFQQLLYHDRF